MKGMSDEEGDDDLEPIEDNKDAEAHRKARAERAENLRKMMEDDGQ